MNRDEIKGKADALKGKIKQAAGDFLDDPDLQDEGVVDEARDAREASAARSARSAKRSSTPAKPSSDSHWRFACQEATRRCSASTAVAQRWSTPSSR
jgi:hypothetical protein